MPKENRKLKIFKNSITTKSSPIKPEVPGNPTEDKTKIIKKTEKIGIALINRL